MPHAGKQSGIGQLEIFQETIRGDRIRQSNSVQNAILFHPGIQGIPVGICRIVLVIALPGTHDPFMLSCTCLCDQTGLTHLLCQQCLSKCIVDLVGTGVV